MTWLLFRAELARAIHDSCLVIITGGLGPTSDDLTREIVAEAAGVPLDFHQEAWDALLARFAGTDRLRHEPQAGAGAAGIRPSAEPERHRAGLPGRHSVRRWWWRFPVRPPSLRPMFSASVLPLIAERFGGRRGGGRPLGHGVDGARVEPGRGSARRRQPGPGQGTMGHARGRGPDRLQPPRRPRRGAGGALRLSRDTAGSGARPPGRDPPRAAPHRCAPRSGMRGLLLPSPARAGSSAST